MDSNTPNLPEERNSDLNNQTEISKKTWCRGVDFHQTKLSITVCSKSTAQDIANRCI